MMNYLEEYDETNPISIETYAKRLIGKTFADVCRQDDITKAMVVRETANYEVKHENKKRKGGLGELIEERFFFKIAFNSNLPYFSSSKEALFWSNKGRRLLSARKNLVTSNTTAVLSIL